MKIIMKHDGSCNPLSTGVRLLMEKDYAEYQAVLLASGYKPWAKKKMRKVANQYVPGTWYGYVVKGKIVSVAAAEFGPPRGVKDIFCARIAAVATLPEYRGKDHATRTVSAVIGALYFFKYNNIYVAVHKENKSAVALYKKVGFA